MSGKKKILFVITKATWGGAQRYVFDLATSLPKDRFDAVVAFGKAGKLADDLVAGGISVYKLPTLHRDIAIFSDIQSFFQILRCIRKIRPDVIHLNSSKAAALGALAARITGVPRIVFTVHGWPFKEHRNVLARLLIYKISWFTALLSHATIVVSKADEVLGKRMWFVGKKIHYIPIGIEPPRFLPRVEAGSALGIISAGPRLVTIAELTANKGIRYAIEAISLLKQRGTNVDYSVIGDGEERERLQALAQEKNVSDRVRFLGFVPNAVQYLKAFDIFLLPSIKEGMPYVLIEAGMARLKTVSTDIVDTESLGPSWDVIKVKPANSSMIVDAIIASLLPDTEPPMDVLSPLFDMVERTIKLY